ncbi:hypothetical protein [Micromonospora sp. NBC_01796]|uniref:hypothetical protein n=1 Tax=Micromonospora sp. NBC_01796 TaxID=2975987 RepID=UPI002DDB09F4|nr:hypothetical protein [Micromonospora sp. NBC_01796]WSA84524.1 hypothetical protein OIE47_29830 [Micromonospora sp. NBC_01796]
MSRWKSSTVLTVSAVAMLGLTACGPQDAATETKKEPTVLELLASDAKGSIQKTATTIGSATSITFTMDGKGEGEPIKGSGFAILGTDRKAEMTLEDPKEGPTTVRIIGSAMYVGISAAEQAEFDGKKWLKMDAGMAGQEGTEAMSSMLDNIDPGQSLKPVLTAETVTVVGEETVNGAKTVHYTATVPSTAYVAATTDAKAREALEKELTKLGVKEVKVDLWVDEQYQLRRFRAYLNDANDITADYTEYNKALTVDVPPAAETADFAEMMKGLADALKDLEG